MTLPSTHMLREAAEQLPAAPASAEQRTRGPHVYLSLNVNQWVARSREEVRTPGWQGPCREPLARSVGSRCCAHYALTGSLLGRRARREKRPRARSPERSGRHRRRALQIQALGTERVRGSGPRRADPRPAPGSPGPCRPARLPLFHPSVLGIDGALGGPLGASRVIWQGPVPRVGDGAPLPAGHAALAIKRQRGSSGRPPTWRPAGVGEHVCVLLIVGDPPPPRSRVHREASAALRRWKGKSVSPDLQRARASVCEPGVRMARSTFPLRAFCLEPPDAQKPQTVSLALHLSVPAPGHRGRNLTHTECGIRKRDVKT